MNKLPDFIIIGAMKCATSSLHEQLAKQPGIFMSELKEPNFFSDDEQYVRGIDWYLSHFSDASPDEICGESSTHYTKLPTYPHTIERLQKYLPNAKFIYVMRHPIDRLISQYIHEWSQRVITVDINQAIYQHPELIEYSLYTKQLKPYFEAFGKGRVFPLFFERILSNKQQELEGICEFIGYKGQAKWNEQLNASNVSNQRMIKSKWRNFFVNTPGLREIRRWFIPKSFRNWVKNFWTMQNKPELTPENIKYLQEIFDQDLGNLGAWLGIEINCDNFKKIATTSSIHWVE
ncbi:MAG TPA: sulfotransferase [Cyanothece sp. UBA12306]|nr:sulfotransferase [Cyanothece sp. UBA12306]